MNEWFGIGRLVRDVEVKYTQAGLAVAQFTLAIDRIVKSGAEKKADFIPVVLFGKSAETAGNTLDKGRKVAVKGHIQTRSYDAKDGTKRYVTEIIGERFEYCDDKRGGGQQHAPDDAGVFGTEVSPEDDIPF